MATAVASSALQGDLEKGHGQVQPSRTRMTNYVRDITYKVIPFCIGFLIVLSAGAILVAALDFGQLIPRKDIVVVAIMLLVLFILFCIGGCYLYIKRRYPPLTKGPNAPDRPPPKKPTWKERASTVGTLTIGKFRIGKIHNHREIQPRFGLQETPNNPVEMESVNQPVGQPPHGQQHQIIERRSSIHPLSTARNQIPHHISSRNLGKLAPPKKAQHKPPMRKPVPSRLRNSVSASNGVITGMAGEDESIHPQVSPRYGMDKSFSETHWTTRDSRAPQSDREAVSPMNLYQATSRNNSFSAYTPRYQMSGSNGNPRARNGPPMTPPNPQSPRNIGIANGYPISALRPEPQAYHLDPDKSDPLANLVLVPEDINEQAFVEGLPERLAEDCLHIFDGLPTIPDHELEAASFGGESKHYTGKPRGQGFQWNTGRNLTHTHMTRSPTSDLGDIGSPIGSSSPRPRPKPKQTSNPQKPTARDSQKEKGKSKVNDVSLDSHRPYIELERPDVNRKGQKPPSQTKINQASTANFLTDPCDKPSSKKARDNIEILSPCPNSPPPILPSLPRKARPPPPSHKDPEPTEHEKERLDKIQKPQTSKYRNYSQVEREAANETPPNRTWKQQATRNRNHRATPTAKSHAPKREPLKPAEQAWLNTQPWDRYLCFYPYYQMPWAVVPPRWSSRGFYDYYAANRRTASEISSSISREYQRYSRGSS
ncbi:hypothetical protein F4804DRAFT_352317 [Jackrogersella minutella]|nr:hypothetical protein F4804DRAFT_352317 [Jackrogersella minutella]